MDDTENINAMLHRLGVRDRRAQSRAIDKLKESGVMSSRARRSGIARFKVDRAAQVLNEMFAWHCNRGECRRLAKESGRIPLAVDQRSCSQCGGSPDRQSLYELSQRMLASGLSRLLVVGGTNCEFRTIRDGSPDTLSWRFVDGTKARTDRHYRELMEWADVIVIWGSTPLNHSVSNRFSKAGDDRVVEVAKRGIRALAIEIIRHLDLKISAVT